MNPILAGLAFMAVGFAILAACVYRSFGQFLDRLRDEQ